MKSARLFIVSMLVGALLVAGATRQWTMTHQAARERGLDLPGAKPAVQSASLSSMDSYALALLLGGLRGPLVMFLWTSSESQKTEHDLTDFDTKVEWIRLLQPEFDAVHLFEIWNKAYNISVQMASLPNKYATILDALEYAYSVNREHPDDINIISNIGSLFTDKLGNSQEKEYYIRRVRDESQAIHPSTLVRLPDEQVPAFINAARQAGMDEPLKPIEEDPASKTASIVLDRALADRLKPQFDGKGVVFTNRPLPVLSVLAGEKPTRLNPMLDENGNVLPEFLTPTHPRPADLAPDAPWYDGSTLQFLQEFAPYPYGLPPHAIGYNYLKRSQMLSRVAHEQHVQESEFVVDSRPLLALKTWAAQEAEQGRRAELRYFGQDDAGDPSLLEQRAPGTDVKQPSDMSHELDPAAGQRALYEYRMAAKLYHASRLGLIEHLRRFPSSVATYSSHVDENAAFEHLYHGDFAFLNGIVHPDLRSVDWAAANQEYQLAHEGFEYVILHYFIEDAVADATYPIDPSTGRKLSHENIDRLSVAQREALFPVVLRATEQYVADVNHLDSHHDERQENLAYFLRSLNRQAFMSRTLTSTSPTSQPVSIAN